MYGQGNFGPPTTQGPYSSSMFHQLPLAPSLPPFPQGSQPPRSTLVQHGPLPVPSQVGQLGHPSYEHTLPVPHQLGPPLPVPSSGVSSRPFLTMAPPPMSTQPPQVHANSQILPNSQWVQSANFVPPTVTSVAPMVLPPPPSQGKTLYGSQVQQPPRSGMQANPQPHQPSSSFFTSPHVGAYGQPQTSNMLASGPLPPPPPLPTSPPGALPLPPSSPPPTSSIPFSSGHIPRSNPTVSGSTFHDQNSSKIDRSVGSVDEDFTSCLVVDDAYKPDGSGKRNFDGESASKMSSSCTENLIFDLPPPPKPVDDRTVHSIKVLCHFIAKNGPEFEDMTRRKEFGNPQFKFLFGGEPGSEDAVAHKYFIWMKNKCQLALKSAGVQQTKDSPVRPLGDCSSQLNTTADAGMPQSPADSDMDMEDDITHPDQELQIHPSNNLSHETVSVSGDLDMKDQMQLSHSEELSLDKDTMYTKSMGSESFALEEERQGFRTSSDQNQCFIGKSVAKADGSLVDSSRSFDSPLGGKAQYSFSPAKMDLVESSSEKRPDLLAKGASAFRLLEGYASEGNSDNDSHVKDAAPSTVTLGFEVHGMSRDKSTEENSGAELRPSFLASNQECDPLSESCKSQDFSSQTEAVTAETDMISATGKLKYVDSICNDQGLVKDGISHGPRHKESASTDANIDAPVAKKDTMSMSAELKVDRFGRLIKEGASDSDSDGSPHYTGRRGKRDRSRSRSRSPHDRRRRRRSPWGRKDRRGRSRSFSPKRRRSRSRSPLHRDEYPSDKMRRDKGQFPECFDFRRGKCYRGASCRYLHHEDKNDRSRSHRSKQSLQDLARNSRRSDLNEKNENTPRQKSSHQHDEGRDQGLKPCEHVHGADEKNALSEPAAYTSVGKLEVDQSQGHYLDKTFQNLDQQHERMDRSESSPIQTSVPIPSQIPSDKPQLNKDSIIDSHTILSNMNKSENIPFQSVAAPHESIPAAADNISHLLPSSFPLPSQEMTASYTQQVSNALNSASVENYPAHQASISYPHSQFPFPSNPAWNFLPPPPVLSHLSRPFSVNDVVGTSSMLGQYSDRPVNFQQNMLPQRNQFVSQTSTGPYIVEFPAVSHVGQNQTYSSMQEPVRPSHLLDDLQPRTFPSGQNTSELHGGPDLLGKDRFTERPLQGLYPLNAYMAENLHSQSLPFKRESPSERAPPADSSSSLPGDDAKASSTMSRYTSGLLEKNQPSQFTDFGGSGISSHYNPYASTFEQPSSSKFDSNILVQEKDRPYGSHSGTAYTFGHVPGDGKAVSLGSNTISPKNTVQGAERTLPRPTGDQYDPLYDSIEPSSNLVKKLGQTFEATDESDTMVRLSGSNKPLDVEENNKQKGGGAIALTESVENEEYGETADAEVGAVEDGSASNPDDAEGIAAGEVEIDQVKAPGRGKKNKDSRSTKLFKVALANFVKEVLKPSWRQGNMSKEAFKTIVKKTVEKVSGAMKSHQIPKSQTKINRYIDSSQRKLTKLVMGYVDKYVKV